jgi:hypothetical protein
MTQDTLAPKAVRLACTDCERQDHDGITEEQFRAVRRRWGNVRKVRDGQSSWLYWDPTLDWYTHLGLCPDCRQKTASP